MTIDELEKLLNGETDHGLTILPSGEIQETYRGERPPKVLTMRENLGGEYGL